MNLIVTLTTTKVYNCKLYLVNGITECHCKRSEERLLPPIPMIKLTRRSNEKVNSRKLMENK